MCAVEEVTLLLSVLRGTRFLVLPSAKPLSDRRDVRLSSTLVPSPITLPSEKVYSKSGIAPALATFAERQVTWQRTAGSSTYEMRK